MTWDRSLYIYTHIYMSVAPCSTLFSTTPLQHFTHTLQSRQAAWRENSLRRPKCEMRLSILIAAVLVTVCNAASRLCPCKALHISGLNDTIFPTTLESSPNPIATVCPQNVTGTINGTIAVVPIPLGKAQSIIPAQYGILAAQFESILPGFPSRSYPLII